MNKKVVVCQNCGTTIEMEPGDKIYDYGWAMLNELPICVECDERNWRIECYLKPLSRPY
jgi:hypothetical protein